MIRSNLEQFDGSTNFMVQIVEGQFHTFRVACGAGGVNNDGRIAALPLGEGGVERRRVRVTNFGKTSALTRQVSRLADLPASPGGRGEGAL